MNTLLPFASGKGGVGKTLLVANLGVALAKKGKTVILIDLDLGGSNLHTCLGVKNRNPGIGNYIYKQSPTLESLIIPTDVLKLHFIPGDSLLPGTANLQYFVKKKIIKEIPNLTADYILLDLGGGSAFNTLDFFLTSYSGIIVTVPETTAILNSYSFIKSAVYRMLYRSFPSKSEERTIIQNFLTRRIEGGEVTFGNLLENLRQLSQSSAQTAEEQLNNFYPRIIMNMGKSERDLVLGSKLREIVGNNLHLNIEYIGYVGFEPKVPRSILERVPLRVLFPSSPFSRTVDSIADSLIHSPEPKAFHLYESDEDLSELFNKEAEIETAESNQG